MKSLDDLSTDPNDGREDPKVQSFIDECRELAEAEGTAYAAETLNGIADTVERTRTVTDGQIRAVWNIQSSVRQREDRRERSSRRYEGWRKNGWPGQ